MYIKPLNIMKIAVPTRDSRVDDHFGHCDHYTIFTIENRQIVSRESLPSPEGCGCKSGIAAVLKEMGVEVMLAGNMGEGAKNVLQKHDIAVIRGCKGDIETLVQSYLLGFILDSGEGCDHHDCGNH
jgi:predicted Fe-Mo cluster-binding NifX family protein